MSNLMLCHAQSAEMPYSVVGLGINIYSAEELCYLIAQNAHTIDQDFMDDKLCEFLDRQLKLTELAKKLRELLHEGGTLSDFVMAILNGIDYCDEDEKRSIKQILIESSGLSPARKHKSRGDNLLKARRFARAIDEYVSTLEKIDMEAEPILYAAVLHNMGTTYAKMMLFEKAAEYYLEAYRLNMDEESLVSHLLSCSLYMSREQYDRMLIRCGYPERAVDSARRILETRDNYDRTPNRYAEQLRSLKELKEDGKIGMYYDMVEETLDSWKREYRLNMILR